MSSGGIKQENKGKKIKKSQKGKNSPFWYKNEQCVSVREEKREKERKGKRGFSLFSKIYKNRAVGFHRSKKKS